MAFQFLLGLIAFLFAPLMVVSFWVLLAVVFLVLLAHAMEIPLPKPRKRVALDTFLNGPEES